MFPPEVDLKRTSAYMKGLVNYPEWLGQGGFAWPGAREVVDILRLHVLEGPRLLIIIRRFRAEVQAIHEGLLPYGKYTKAERMRDKPQRDYGQAVRGFLAGLRRADPGIPIAGLRLRLLGTRTRSLEIYKSRDRNRVLFFCREFLKGLGQARKEGRPPKPNSILIYHLVNNLTEYRRKNGRPLMDKRRRNKLERRWDDAVRVLVWIHYNRMPMPWLGQLVRRWGRSPAAAMTLRVKKIIQRKYAHLGPPADAGLSPEAAFHPLGIHIFALLEDGRFMRRGF